MVGVEVDFRNVVDVLECVSKECDECLMLLGGEDVFVVLVSVDWIFVEIEVWMGVVDVFFEVCDC